VAVAFSEATSVNTLSRRLEMEEVNQGPSDIDNAHGDVLDRVLYAVRYGKDDSDGEESDGEVSDQLVDDAKVSEGEAQDEDHDRRRSYEKCHEGQCQIPRRRSIEPQI